MNQIIAFRMGYLKQLTSFGLTSSQFSNLINLIINAFDFRNVIRIDKIFQRIVKLCN